MGTKLKQRGSPPNLLPSEKFFVSNTPSHRKTSSFCKYTEEGVEESEQQYWDV